MNEELLLVHVNNNATMLALSLAILAKVGSKEQQESDQ